MQPQRGLHWVLPGAPSVQRALQESCPPAKLGWGSLCNSSVESEEERYGLAIPYMGRAQAFDAQRSKRLLRKKRSETEKLQAYLGGTARSAFLTSCGVRLRSDPKREASQRKKKKNEAVNSAGSAPFCKTHHFLLFEPNIGGQHFDLEFLRKLFSTLKEHV